MNLKTALRLAVLLVVALPGDVRAAPPVASAGGPYAIVEGDALGLDASASFDPDFDPLTFTWDLDADGAFGDALGMTPAVPWATLLGLGFDGDSTYTVSVAVDDGAGGADTASASVTVTNAPPVLTASGVASIQAGLPFTLSLGATDPGPDTITQWTVNWGDGTVDSLAGNPSSAQHTYGQAMAFRSITVSATDEDGTWTSSDLLVGTYASSDQIRRYDGSTGAPMSPLGSSGGELESPYGITFGSGGDIYVSGYRSNNIVRFDAAGSYQGEFATAAELSNPAGLVFGPDGHLYVSNYGSDEVLRFDGQTGVLLGVFGGSGQLRGPAGLTFGPDGDLWISAWDTGKLMKMDGVLGGAPVTVLSGLAAPDQLAFDGTDLYIAMGYDNAIDKWDGTDRTTYFAPPELSFPTGVTWGPDGLLYVSSYNNDRILRTDGGAGEVWVDSGAGGLDEPEQVAFTPAHQVTVLASPVVADAGAGYAIAEGDSLQLDGSASQGASLTYEWDLNADGLFGDVTGATPAVAWDSLAAYSIDDDSTYTVALRVSDGAIADSVSTSVTVTNRAPVLTTTGTGAAQAGAPYTLTLGASDPGDDTIAYWKIHWGDGAIDSIPGNPPSAQHTYAATGLAYPVLASATDEDGTFLQNELLVPSFATARILRFAPTTGDSLQVFGSFFDGLNGPTDCIVGPDGDLYVSTAFDNSVLRYDTATGAFLGKFVPSWSGGLVRADGLAFGPDGNLYVTSGDTHQVLRYDGETGGFLGAFVPPGGGGLDLPGALHFGPSGDLWVGSKGTDQILRYDGATGVLVDSLAVAPGNVQDFAFGPDGHLYAAFRTTATVVRYDLSSGTSLGDFVPAGSGGLQEPRGLGFGPDGHLYVASTGFDDAIRRYDGESGAYLGDYVAPGAAGLNDPFFFTFRPGHQVLVSSTGVDLVVAKTADVPTLAVGDPVNYEIVVTNLGPEAATGVAVADSLPAGLTYQTSTATQGSYDDATGLWTVGAVGIAAADTLYLTATADSSAGGSTLTNVAAVAAVDQADLDPASDADSVDVDVLGFGPSPIEVSVLDQGNGKVLPGEDPVEVLRLRIVNSGAEAETLSTVRLSNATIGPGTPVQLAAEWAPLRLTIPPDAEVFAVAFADSVAEFPPIDREIAPGDTAVLVIESGASLMARDGDTLDLLVADPSDLVFGRPVALTGSWPLDPNGDFKVDGMTAAQIAFEDAGRSVNLQTGTTRNLVAEFVVPANGYEPDTLSYLNLRNAGTAVGGSDILRMEAWRDLDADGVFEPAGDDAAGWLGEMLDTGNRWEKTALALPVPVGGIRLFVSADIAEQATVGATLRLLLPESPDHGLGMASANDGPIDTEVGHATTQTITTSDRLTVSAVGIEPSIVAPGVTDVPLLHVVISNDYPDDRTVTGLTVRNITAGPGTQAELDGQVGQLRLRADSLATPALAQAIFAAGSAALEPFSLVVPAGGARELLVSADVSNTLAADGDVLALDLEAEGVELSAPATVIASWPVDSGARATVDGMLANRITNHGAPPATLGPAEGPALALDLTLPSNGYQADVLLELRVENLGTATSADIASMELWRDGGDGSFDAGGFDDVPLGPLSPFGNEWINPSLTNLIPVGGARYFVSLSTAAVVTDSATVRLSVPLDGVTVDSGNDGPLDLPIPNSDAVIFSTASLLTNLAFDRDRSTVGDTGIQATMTVRNVGTTTIENVTPSTLTPEAPGVVSVLSGPVPAATDLPPSGEVTFTWVCAADSAGSTRFSGNAAGTELGTGLARRSLDTTSEIHRVFVQAQDLEVFPVESMPFSINRGQANVVPLSLTFANESGADGSTVRITDLRIRFEDEGGAGIVPADLLSRVVVNEGTDVYLERTALETSGDVVDLALATPVDVPADGQVTLSLSLDIANSTTVPTFRVVIPDSTAPWFVAEDATNGAPVTIHLVAGESYPIRSGLARVVAEATQLNVAAVPAPDLTAGRGQADVSLLGLTLENFDPDSLAADVRVSSFEVALVDSAGAPISQPDLWLERIRVLGPLQTLLDRPVTASDGATFALVMSPLLSLPVNTPVVFDLRADLAAGAPLGTCRLQLADAASFDARDANTGAPVAVVYDTDPLEGPLVTVQLPADSVVVSSWPELPASLPVGASNVPAFTVVLRHPGGAGTAAVQVESMTVRCQAGAAAPLVPATYLDRVWVLRGGAEIGAVADLPTSGDEFVLPVPLAIAPGGVDSVAIRFDGEVAAPVGVFEMTVAATALQIIDVNSGSAVAGVPAPGESFPLSSGLTQLSAPARELRVAFEDAMPAVLAADGSTVAVARVTLRNPAPPTSGGITIGSLEVRAGDADLAALPIGAAFTRVEAWREGTIWAASGLLAPDTGTAQLVATEDLQLLPSESAVVELRGEVRNDATVPSVRIGLESAGIGVLQPVSTLLSISVVPEDQQSFPFWTLAGNFGANSLEDSWTNFPNPFAAGRNETTFAFFLSQPAVVTVELYTLRGERVITLLEALRLPSGLHQDQTWDGRNGSGQVVLNGTYVATIKAAFEDGTSEQHLRKVAVVR